MQKERISPDYFSPKAYIKSEAASGLLSTQQGKRLVAIPDLFVNSIHQTILSKLGEAASITFYTFGFSWGKTFFERIHKEIELYYKTPISQIGNSELCATIQEIWSVHGLGKIIVDFAIAPKGLLLVTIENSGISMIEEEPKAKSFSMEAGFLGGWFSALTRKDLTACTRQWDTEHVQHTEYLIGGKKQIAELEESFCFWDSVALEEWDPSQIKYSLASESHLSLPRPNRAYHDR